MYYFHTFSIVTDAFFNLNMISGNDSVAFLEF